MAFAHCHGCGWTQDDFWSWGYNPISWFLSRVFFSGKHSLIFPRYINYDKWLARDLGWKSNQRHSWVMIGHEFNRMLRKLWKQHWWTWEDYKRSNHLCPQCGKIRVCID